jgi:RNA polymerase sigma-70 factor (ECF subfamily)
MQSQFSNEDLLKNVLANGDKEAFKYLVKTFFKKLCAYAYSLCHDKVQAEDIVQNVFLKLWRNKEQIRKIKRLSSFLYRSVYNEFIDQYRQTKDVLSLEKKHIESLSSILEDERDEHVDKLIQLINQEIECLPPKCKKTFLLSKKEGLTNFEIADYLDISVKAVEAHITKAYRILREKLNKT